MPNSYRNDMEQYDIDFNKYPKNIYNSKIYTNLSELLKERDYQQLDEDDITELELLFKFKEVKFLSLDFKTFFSLSSQIINCSNIIIRYHINKNISIKDTYELVKVCENNFSDNTKYFSLFAKESNEQKVNIYFN